MIHFRHIDFKESVAEDDDDSPCKEEKLKKDEGVLLGSVDPTTMPDEHDQWRNMVTHWDPNDVIAPEGYSWFGKYAFIWFGPARDKIYISATLAVGVTSDNIED